MSGLATICRVGPLIETRREGRFQLRGRTLRHLGEAEAQIVSNRGDLIRIVTESTMRIPDETDRENCIVDILEHCRSKWLGARSSDIQRFYSSPEGRIFGFWQSARDYRPDLRYEDFEDIYCEEVDADPEWERKVAFGIEVASGDADVCRMYKIAGSTWDGESDAFDDFMIEKAELFQNLFSEPFRISPDQLGDMSIGQLHLIISRKDKGVTDFDYEESLKGRKLNFGFRHIKKAYTQSYRKMAKNLIKGLPATAGMH